MSNPTDKYLAEREGKLDTLRSIRSSEITLLQIAKEFDDLYCDLTDWQIYVLSSLDEAKLRSVTSKEKDAVAFLDKIERKETVAQFRKRYNKLADKMNAAYRRGTEIFDSKQQEIKQRDEDEKNGKTSSLYLTKVDKDDLDKMHDTFFSLYDETLTCAKACSTIITQEEYIQPSKENGN